MEDIAKNARKVMVMHKSQLAMYGTVDEIFSRSEELTKMGLDIPQIKRIFLRLRKDGYNLRSSVYSSQQAVDEIMSYMQRNIQND